MVAATIRALRDPHFLAAGTGVTMRHYVEYSDITIHLEYACGVNWRRGLDVSSNKVNLPTGEWEMSDDLYR